MGQSEALLPSIWRNLSQLLAHPYNRDRRSAALARYARWQLASRLAAAPVLVDFVGGVRLAVKTGMTGATGNIYSGLHEFDDMAFVLHVLRAGDLFVDVGANVGAYSMLAAAAGAQVVAVEPAADAFDWLNLNIRLNDLGDQVRPVHAALGRTVGAVRLTRGMGTVNHVEAADDATGGEETTMTTLDQLVGARTPLLIKMDVEGFETEVVAGGERTLGAENLLGVIMELNGSGARYDFDETALHERMLDFGFSPWRYDGWARRLSARGGRGLEGNTLYLRDAPRAEARIAGAPRFDVQGRSV